MEVLDYAFSMLFRQTLIVLIAAIFLVVCFVVAGAMTKDNATQTVGSSMKNSSRKISRAGYNIDPLTKEAIATLAKKLTPEQYKVTQNAGTEPAFCGNLLDNKKDGVYCCVVCGLPLFSSENKFNSGTGWQLKGLLIWFY